MACKAGRCGSCVFTIYQGSSGVDWAGCIMRDDPVVQETYQVFYDGGICSKYQLNPAALDPAALED